MENKECKCGAKLYCIRCGKMHLCLRWCDNFYNSLRCDAVEKKSEVAEC